MGGVDRGDQMKDITIEMVERGSKKYFTKTVTYNLEMPLQPQPTTTQSICLPRRWSRSSREPCLLPVLRWGFSLLALAVLGFVLFMFGAMLYDVLVRSLAQ